MARGRQTLVPTLPRGVSENLLAPAEVAGRIHNFVPTPDGTLRAVVGPAEYVPTYEGADAAFGTFALVGGWGLHHALINGGRRSVLLMHGTTSDNSDATIYEHRGWRVGQGSTTGLGWTPIVGPVSGAMYNYTCPETDDRAGFLTQFVSTPNGVVMVPQGGRAFFYDGEIVAPLGYAQRPGAVQGLGPTSTRTSEAAFETSGYNLAGRHQPQCFGNNRIGSLVFQAVNAGTTAADSNPLGAVLQQTSRRAVQQWVDLWGNLSPASPESDAVRLPKEDNLTKDRRVAGEEPGEALRKQVVWTGVQKGPERTVARILGLTKDLENSGDPRYYEAPGDTTVALTAFATIPDNSVTIWADNVPDTWLNTPVTNVDPVPLFRLGALAFGRLWVANWPGEEGAIRPSLPGRWGTFEQGGTIFPDPSAEVTGLLTVPDGLIVTTEQSTFLVTLNDEGQGFLARTLSRRAGCVSPNSMQVLPNGTAVWLGREGFYACDGSTVALVSQTINNEVMRRINRGRWRRAVAAVDVLTGEYRCWVPIGATADNNLCVIFDGKNWRTRDDVKAKAVCTTEDHRGMMLALGTVEMADDSSRLNVWALDHAARASVQPAARAAVFETTWMRMPGRERGSAHDVEWWLRATSNSLQGSLTVCRDWKEHPVIETHADVSLVSDEDANLFWGSTALGGSYTEELRSRQSVANHWTARRPYWYRADVHVPDAEVVKYTLRVTGDVDVVGLTHSDNTSVFNGASRPAKR